MTCGVCLRCPVHLCEVHVFLRVEDIRKSLAILYWVYISMYVLCLGILSLTVCVLHSMIIFLY